MSVRNFNPEERAKLKSLFTESLGVMTEIEVLTGGLNDTITAIADEMQKIANENGLTKGEIAAAGIDRKSVV